MVGTFDGTTPNRTAHVDLARLMDRELGTEVDAERLKRFLLAHWSKISHLAHTIHDHPGPEPKTARSTLAYQRQGPSS